MFLQYILSSKLLLLVGKKFIPMMDLNLNQQKSNTVNIALLKKKKKKKLLHT